MADVIKKKKRKIASFAFTKEKKKVFLKELSVFFKISRMYVSACLQYYQNERLNSTAGRDAFPFAL